MRPGIQNTPSGIAQLRKTSESNLHGGNHNGNSIDSMNIDDFIFSENAGTPAGLASPPSLTAHLDATSTPKCADERTASSTPSAIPIKSRKDSANHFVPQSVPVPAHNQTSTNGEFNYVNRHLRKTSIDERRVSELPLVVPLFAQSYHGWCCCFCPALSPPCRPAPSGAVLGSSVIDSPCTARRPCFEGPLQLPQIHRRQLQNGAQVPGGWG